MIDKAWMTEYNLVFNIPAKTSRDILSKKTSFFIHLQDDDGRESIGECAPIFGLSIESESELRIKISEVIYLLNHKTHPANLNLHGFPSLSFAIDTAQRSLLNKGDMTLFNTSFSKGDSILKINGLIWMDSLENMMEQVKLKSGAGFKCIKIKIGAHDFNQECELLSRIREEYGSNFELRLDANGAFNPEEAMDNLNQLSVFNIHSIEQPIQAGQIDQMAELCSNSPIPIALDEELIGIEVNHAVDLLGRLNPQFIILKPSLIGNFEVCDKWIKEAEKLNIRWWTTSALESNIGLNAIAQWVSTYDTNMYQGLGTGQIYSNNIDSPLSLSGEDLMIDKCKKWDLSALK